MQRFKITLSNSAKEWHWALAEDCGGKMHITAKSIQPLSSLIAAAAEVEAEIMNPGHTQRFYRPKSIKAQS